MTSNIRSIWLALLAASVLLAGCQLPPSGGAGGAGGARAASPLCVGLGWSEAANPADAGREAAAAAAAGLGKHHADLVLVWDNWPELSDSRKLLAGVAQHFAARITYGGRVAWPVATRWTTAPTVTVVAFGGGWRVTAGGVGEVLGREEAAGAALRERLGLPPAAPRAVRALATQPGGANRGDAAPGGQLILMFGDLSGPQADRLVVGLTEHGARQPLLIGGGAGEGGSGRQYVGGRVTSNAVWAVRLEGAFRARAVRESATADRGSINAAAASAASRLAVGRRAGAPWRLVLMVESSGWLAALPRPQQDAIDAAERFGAGTLVAGWMGDSQIGPAADDGALVAGQFDLAMAVIEPGGGAE